MLTFNEVIEATKGRLLYGTPNGVKGVSIDSRTIEEGQLFVAIKGEKFDGHDFLFEALKRGSGALVSAPPMEPPKGKVVVYVNNTLKALQDMALYQRKKSSLPVFCVTGTNGKTTTKEMAASVLGTKFRTLKNTGNLNNQIGLPLSLLKMTGEEDVAVLEMGASLPCDIKELCGIALPDYGIVTNIGHAHIEGFTDIETVRKTKLELLEFVKTVSVNADDAFLMEGINKSGFKGRVIRCGIRCDSLVASSDTPCDIYASDIELGDRSSSFTLHIGEAKTTANINVPGIFNIHNALLASSVGMVFDMGIDEIRSGLESFRGVPMRVEITELGGATVISDAYNANPASMEEAVLELERLRGRRAVAVLGDMLELGPYTELAHRKLGAWMSGLKIDLFIAVGPLMSIAADAFSGRSVKAVDSVEAKKILHERIKEGDTILIKGSRGMRMERILSGEGVPAIRKEGPVAL